MLTVAGWLALDGRGRGTGSVRDAAPALAVVAGLVLLAGLVPVAGAFEPRRLVDPPHRTLDEPSPLPYQPE